MAIENATFHVKTGEFFEEISFGTDPRVDDLKKYSDVYTISKIETSDWITELGFNTSLTVNKLFELFPINKSTESIYIQYSDSVFNISLPTTNSGFLSIEKYDNNNGVLKFVDNIENGEYIKSIKEGIWSNWVSKSDLDIIGTTDISDIGDGTLTGGLNTVNSNLGTVHPIIINPDYSIPSYTSGYIQSGRIVTFCLGFSYKSQSTSKMLILARGLPNPINTVPLIFRNSNDGVITSGLIQSDGTIRNDFPLLTNGIYYIAASYVCN